MPTMLVGLELSAYILAEEIRSGKWSHVEDLMKKPVPACGELIEELERRCPGFSLVDYQAALAEGMQNSK